jgi:hypothetical protein
MVPIIHLRTVTAILSTVALMAVSGCGGDTPTPEPTTAKTSASATGGQTYSSKAFALPLTVTVDPVLASSPSRDSRNLLSWDAVASPDNKVRFLVPVELYRPGKSTPEAPPKDYLTYLEGLTKAGVDESQVGKISVDGNPATLMTMTWAVDASHPEGSFDGVLGCPTRGLERSSDDCYGPQPDLLLRLAFIDVGDTPLLAWARMPKDHPDPAFAAQFERMLTTARLS